MQRKWLTIWHVLLILLVLEVACYGATTGIIAYCKKNVARQWDTSASVWQEVDQVPYADIINRYAKKEEVSAIVVASVIQTESAFRPKAISSTGAVGLMQIMPDTWRDINRKFQICVGRHSGECTLECYYDPEMNIRIGTAYLGQLVKRYHGDITFAVAAFNAGPGAVDYYGGVPPYKETEAYVSKVRDSWYELSGMSSLPQIRQVMWEKGRKGIGWSIVATLCIALGVIRKLHKCCRSWRWR